MRNLIFFLALGFLFACKKNQPPEPTVPNKYEGGILVLNEGLFEQNNASITFYNGTEVFQQVFKSENGRGLGDTANDFETYGWGGVEFVIVAVDISSQLEIFNRTTLKSISQIPLFDSEGHAREPRQIIIHNFTAYVCNFDGTIAVIDLISRNLSTLIEVGANPDGMAIVNDQLFVSNSGGLLYPVYDSTVSVIDLNSNLVVNTFKTRINCTQIIADSEGDLYQVSNGNYDDIPPALVRINAESHVVEEIIEGNFSSLTFYGDWIYYYDGDLKAVRRFNSITENFDPSIIIDLSSFETFHGLFIDETKQQLYCIDANGYVNSSTVNAYKLDGTFLYEFQGGLVATDLIFNP